jgi:hypothetical protein
MEVVLVKLSVYQAVEDLGSQMAVRLSVVRTGRALLPRNNILLLVLISVRC